MRPHLSMKPKPAIAMTPRGNRRIKHARGFRRAWLIADHLKRFDDGAGVILQQALMQMWLTEQRRWA